MHPGGAGIRPAGSGTFGLRNLKMAANRAVNSSRVVNIEDLRGLAQRRLPKSVFDYLDGGAEGELTLTENCRVFRDVLFRPRSAIAVGDCDLKTRVLNHELSFPAILAPVGYSRLMHPGGEVAAARAAGEAGTGYILSTISGHKLENVKAASQGPVWYQLYLLGGREAAEGALDRARRAGFSALVITVDTPVAGMRERDPRNGMKELLGTSVFAKIPYLPDILAHPGWLASFLLGGGGVEPRRPSTRFGFSYPARTSGSRRRGKRPGRGAHGWWSPPWQRHCESSLPRRARSSRGTRLRLRTRGRRARWSCPRAGNLAI